MRGRLLSVGMFGWRGGDLGYDPSPCYWEFNGFEMGTHLVGVRLSSFFARKTP